MDFRNHPSSQDLSQHHFSDHHNLTDTASIPRTLFPDHIGHSSTPDSAGNPPPQQTGVGPTWLNSAILQQQSQFLNLQRTPETTPSQLPQGTGNNQWLSRSSVLQRNVSDVNGSMIGAGVSNESGDLGKDYGGSSGGGGGGELTEGDGSGGGGIMNWHNARYIHRPTFDSRINCLELGIAVHLIPSYPTFDS